jgi:hypothetical protein
MNDHLIKKEWKESDMIMYWSDGAGIKTVLRKPPGSVDLVNAFPSVKNLFAINNRIRSDRTALSGIQNSLIPQRMI